MASVDHGGIVLHPKGEESIRLKIALVVSNFDARTAPTEDLLYTASKKLPHTGNEVMVEKLQGDGVIFYSSSGMRTDGVAFFWGQAVYWVLKREQTGSEGAFDGKYGNEAHYVVTHLWPIIGESTR
jgi:hypothetical protein